MSINLSVPEHHAEQEMKPRIMVVGVGGAGGNAVNDMIAAQLEGVEFLVVNTDAQALTGSNAERRVQMGATITRGLGAGAKPEIGKAAAEETLNEILEHLDGSNMAFIAAGMGGGTGTGAAPVIAQAAREKGILTVGVVTKPFHFEGIHRMRQAEAGIEELEQYVDTLIVIPNQNLFRVANEKTTFADAFRMADEVLYSGVRGVTDLMIMPGMINLDFADIRSVMAEMGKAMMGTGEAEGERRSLDAAEAAIANPLLDDTSMKGARGVLINITGGSDMTLFEVDEAANRIRSEVDEEAYIIFGSAFDGDLEGRMRVSVVATGIDTAAGKRAAPAVLSAMAERPAPVSAPVEEKAEDAAEEATEPVKMEDQPLIPFRRMDAVAEAPETIGEMPEETETEAATEEAAEEPVEAIAEETTDAPTMETAVAPVSEEAEVGVEETPAVEASVEDIVEAPVEASAEEFEESKPETAPAAMPGTAKDDAFIPPAPATAPGKEAATPSKPFALSDMMNGSKEKAPSITPAAGSKSVKSRAGSLIDRIMGAKAQAEDVPQPLDWQKGSEATGTPTTADTSKSGETVAEMPAAPRVTPAPATDMPSSASSPMLGGVNLAERPAPAPVEEEDLLDIPAFLRRQAN